MEPRTLSELFEDIYLGMTDVPRSMFHAGRFIAGL